MLGEEFVHFEHRALRLAEHGGQLGIGDDLALVCRVLQFVLADIFPDLAHDFGARQRRGADDRGKFLRRRQRLVEGARGLSPGAFFLAAAGAALPGLAGFFGAVVILIPPIEFARISRVAESY